MHQSSLQIHLKKKNKEKRERKNHGTSKKRSNFVLREYESEVSPRPFYSRIATNRFCKEKNVKKTNFMTVWFQIALWKICAKYRSFQIVSFMQEARISYTKTSQTKSRTFHNNLSVCGLLLIRYISPRLIKDKVEVQFLGRFFSSDALRIFLYQFIAISRGTGC